MMNPATSKLAAGKRASGPEYTRELVDFLHGLAAERLPAEVVDRARYFLLDYLAVAIRGSREESARAAQRMVQRTGAAGCATVIGTPTKRYTIGALTPEQARKEAERLKGLICTGKDPAHEKRAIQETHRRDAAAKKSVETIGREFIHDICRSGNLESRRRAFLNVSSSRNRAANRAARLSAAMFSRFLTASGNVFRQRRLCRSSFTNS